MATPENEEVTTPEVTAPVEEVTATVEAPVEAKVTVKKGKTEKEFDPVEYGQQEAAKNHAAEVAANKLANKS
jgi:hypothetical protein